MTEGNRLFKKRIYSSQHAEPGICLNWRIANDGESTLLYLFFTLIYQLCNLQQSMEVHDLALYRKYLSVENKTTLSSL